MLVSIGVVSPGCEHIPTRQHLYLVGWKRGAQPLDVALSWVYSILAAMRIFPILQMHMCYHATLPAQEKAARTVE